MESKSIEEITERKSDAFEPLVIIEFTSGTKQAAIEWLMAHIQESKLDGGAELEVKMMVPQHQQATILYIGASLDRYLVSAEMMQMRKPHTAGDLREFTISDLENFKGSGEMSTFFTTAEKQKIILKELNSIRASEFDLHIPGYENYKLYPGKRIVKEYLRREVAVRLFPLHEEEFIDKLGKEWYMPRQCCSVQPIGKIQKYFGEKIAMYFAFLGLYTISLIPPALIGIIYFITYWRSVYREAIFAVFNLVWSTIFLESWKRYCSELSFQWGTMQSVVAKFEEPRPDYFGKIGKNPVTGKAEPVYPKLKRVLRFYLVSLPVTAMFLGIAFVFMLTYFWMQAWADNVYFKNKTLLQYPIIFAPTIVYAISIGILNAIYRKVASLLNDFENHRLQSSYENHLIMKLVLFDFVNCFISLFYVAFYLQDRALLRSHLACLLITSQVTGQIKEAMVPFFFVKRRSQQMERAMKKAASFKTGEGTPEVDYTVQKQASLESTMDQYEGTMDEYLELFLQFGYVFLFSSAFPLAALWALLNNITEIRTDAFKMCRIFQRPFAESASGIGAWQIAFEVIGLISVITNCALIGMDPEVQHLMPSSMSTVNMVLIFVAVEHVVLAVKAAVAFFIPDVPRWVEVEMARVEYQSKQALIKENVAASYRKKQMLRKMFLSKEN
ncbi:anoctamin-10-like isoform X2 [Gigantopelta aegis]|uniref:anoctamin-10-like isoform X2 n=1 Tax=Gigantopelta aegis TaxID=1735272 RepID=UPI001B88D62E|nr:anoctamin-10-like isoform X2 [Gigantopelta aegis]